MRTSRHAVLGPLLVVCLTMSACAAESTDVTVAPRVDTGVADVGANARQLVLDRYLEGNDDVVGELLTPELIGLSVAEAQDRAAEDGFDVRVVPFDPASPVTAQSPAYGQPAPLDRVIEIRQGSPDDVTEEPEADVAEDQPIDAEATAQPAEQSDEGDLAAADSPEDQTAPATEEVEPAPAAGVAQADPIAPAYVLPPHTEGRLRINPRQLPALPLGTQLSGNASWYGPGFHGNQTACGGTYDQNGPTIAARELRCGTVVRITGPSGATVEATVTDWGPAEWTGRRFDLSAAVFNAIAPLGAGVIPVRVVTANVPG